ncbi:hypothetical protein SFC88_00295 [Nocardioides sp. HM23]|uniref:hypothetical protein n=1 Tax=Nocardioides bizhenqiangii TaxID=3095076 RepID=UPI002ACA56D9|nr:hypothetical protein [Nocardioides sp. HM23]MDZ5619241.1 hypothetical protein [Nocardioides sp. HM23]
MPDVHISTLALLATGLLALSALVTGCGEDADPLESGDDYSVLGAVGELPASIEGDAQLILTGDLSKASEVAGLDRPSDADSDEVNEWVGDLSGAAAPDDDTARAFVPLPDALVPFDASPSEMDAQVGWSVVDVDSFAALTQPPEDFLVVSGAFDEDTLDEDLSEVDDDIVTDVVGEDHELNVEEPTAFSRIGAPTRLAEDDGRIAASSTTGAVRDWLNGDESLADDAGYGDVARALDEHDVYAAVLSAVQPGIDAAALILGGQVSAEELEALIEQLEDQLPEASYDTVGIGWTTDDDAPLVATAYHFDSEDAAKDSVDALRELYESSTSAQSQRPFSDYLEVEGVETEGSVVVVTSRPAEGAAIHFAYQALVSRDLLFVSQ